MNPFYVITAAAVTVVVTMVVSSIAWGFGRVKGDKDASHRYAGGWEVLAYGSRGTLLARGPLNLSALLRGHIEADLFPRDLLDHYYYGGREITHCQVKSPNMETVYSFNLTGPLKLDPYSNTWLQVENKLDPHPILFPSRLRDESAVFTLTPQ